MYCLLLLSSSLSSSSFIVIFFFVVGYQHVPHSTCRLLWQIPTGIALVLFRLRRNKKLYPSQENFQPKYTIRYGFMFAGYDIGFEWWESVVMFRKMSFVMLAIFLRQYGAAAQVTAASLVLISALSLHLQYRPFVDEGLDRLESFGLHTCLLMLLCALLCNILSADTERNALDISEFQKRSQLGPKSTLAMIVVVFFSTFIFFFCVGQGIILSAQDNDSKGVLVELSRCCARSFPRTCKKKSSVQKDLNNDSINHSESPRKQNNTQVHPQSPDNDIEAKLNQMLEKHLIRIEKKLEAIAISPKKNVIRPPKNPVVRLKRTKSKLSKNHGTIKGSLKYNVKVATLLKKAENQHNDYSDSVVARNQRMNDRQADAKLRLSRRLSGNQLKRKSKVGKDKAKKKKDDIKEKKKEETVVLPRRSPGHMSRKQDLGKIKKIEGKVVKLNSRSQGHLQREIRLMPKSKKEADDVKATLMVESKTTMKLNSRSQGHLQREIRLMPKSKKKTTDDVKATLVVESKTNMIEEATEEKDIVKAPIKIVEPEINIVEEKVDEVAIAVKNEIQPENDVQATKTVDKVDEVVAVMDAVVEKKAKKSKKMSKVVKTTKIVEKAKKKKASAVKRNDTIVSLTAQKDQAIAKEDYQEAERLRKKIAEQEASQNEKKDIEVKQVKTDAAKVTPTSNKSVSNEVNTVKESKSMHVTETATVIKPTSKEIGNDVSIERKKDVQGKPVKVSSSKQPISSKEARVRSMLQKAGIEKCKLLFRHHQKLSGLDVLSGDLLFKKMFSRLKMARVDFDLMMMRLDEDNDGCLSLDEFIGWLTNE